MDTSDAEELLSEIIDYQVEQSGYKEAMKKKLLHGGWIKHGRRKWYNPVRYFKGDLYSKHISLRRILK